MTPEASRMKETMSRLAAGAEEAALVRRHLTTSQAEKVKRLVDAAAEEVRANGYEGLTVRNVASRAGVAAATAYTYFSSKDHLVAEVYWQRLKVLPEIPFDPQLPTSERVGLALRDVGLLLAGEPELASAATSALLSLDPDVKRVCDRIGAALAARLERALGEDSSMEVLIALGLAFSGALLQAGMGYLDYSDVTPLMEEVAALIFGSGPTGGGPGWRGPTEDSAPKTG